MANFDLRLLVASTDPADLPALAGKLREAELLTEMRLRENPSKDDQKPVEVDGKISAAEAARRLGISKAYIYKNAATLPFVARIGRRVVVSVRGLERYQKRMRGE